MKNLFRASLFLLAMSFCKPSAAINDIYVIHLVLDGLRYDMLNQQVAEGNVPTLAEYFVKNGATFDKAITTYPTVSSPGYISFATGLSAGYSGVFFLEWFDRTKGKPVGYLTPSGYNRINSDLLNRLELRRSNEPLLYTPTTIFEKLKDQPTAALYTPFNKGAAVAIPKKFPVKALWRGLVTKDGLALNRMAMDELKKLFEGPENKIPRYSLVALYGTDFYGHKAGPHSEEIQWDLKQFDAAFGDFMNLLEKRGLKNKTYVILSSDHGMHATGKLLELKKILAQKGIKDPKRIYASNRGVSSTFIYVAGESGWEEFPTLYDLQNFTARKNEVLNLTDLLLSEPAIGWLATRDGADRVKIFSKEGEGLMVQTTVGNETRYAYRFRGEDPLDYAKNPTLAGMLNGKPYTAREWFSASVDATRPNAVPDLSNLFQDPRAGDILVEAAAPWSFRTAKAGTHGSLSQGDMHIPLWMWGPDLPKGRFGEARSVDVYPTVLRWFGLKENDSPHEGLFLLDAKKEEPKTATPSATLAAMERELMEYPHFDRQIDKLKITAELQKSIPAGQHQALLEKCREELNRRHRQWKKIHEMRELSLQKENPLQIDRNNVKNMQWLLSNELNVEYLRLRRMENIQSILENP